MTIKDDLPSFFETNENTVKIKALPQISCEAGYNVIPKKRGQFYLENINIRYTGVLNLCVKQVTFSKKECIKVYPSFKDLRRYSFAAIKKNNLLHGNKKSLEHIQGTEFESLREYQYGDDYRKINWMATARFNKLVVNSYETEKNQQIFILIDSSRVMNQEIENIKKLDYAINSAFLLAEIALQKGDNTGLMVFDEKVRRYISPGKGRHQFNLIAENLYNIEGNLVSADYEGALIHFLSKQKRRSLLCIFTELFNENEAKRLIKALRELVFVHVPLIVSIEDTRLTDMTTKSLITSEDVFISTAAGKIIEDRKKVRELFQKAGIACVEAPPDKLSISVINKYLAMKTAMKI